MLYAKSKEKELSKELFQNPTSEYRGTPFWAWNCLVREDQIDFETAVFEEMGMGGAHVHCRVGLNVPYLSDRFLELVEYARQRFEEKGMLTWLYDEDKWPSGYGGGLVTKDHQYRMRFLVFSPELLEEGSPEALGSDSSTGQIKRSSERVFLGSYAIKLNASGGLVGYQYYPVSEGTKRTLNEGYEAWYVYREVSGDNKWFNNQAYVDTLNPKAIARFLEVTHERYAAKLGSHFGKDIPSIFTDEPQFSHKGKMGKAKDKDTIYLPFTDDFDETYQAAYGIPFLPNLPELFWEPEENGGISRARYLYHDHVAERFASAFADQVGQWCEAHGFYLTGHMMSEPTLTSQTAALGEAMRSYRSFGIPGVDMLCDWRELSTAKQTQSAVHQFGREGMLSELYGVTGWDFDFRRHKLAGDWQAALGVTVRVHHLTWMSMEGEAKRDYPACIGYQSPWYKEYRRIEDHFARVNTAMTRGIAKVKIGVIHPVESFWLLWGSDETTGALRNEREKLFEELTEWLLYGRQDFDFISESLLEFVDKQDSAEKEKFADGKDQIDQKSQEAGFKVGCMRYDVILVPNCLTLRRNTLERLKEFAAQGGKVIFVGSLPQYVDAKTSDEVIQLAQNCIQVPFTQNQVMESLEPYRLLDIRDQRGQSAENLIYQLRKDGEKEWLFIVHCEKPKNPDLTTGTELTFRLNGFFDVKLYNTETGEIGSVQVTRKNGQTEWNVMSYPYDSWLYQLIPADHEWDSQKKFEETSESADKAAETTGVERAAVLKNYRPLSRLRLPSRVPVVLEEPNVLVLDLPEGKLDAGEWREREEILRLDNQFRDECGYPQRMDAYAQPWTYGELAYEHQISLRYEIYSEVDVDAVELALEHADITSAIWNGKPVEKVFSGYYVDREIKKFPVGSIWKGMNTLELTIPYHANINLEAVFLLGDFGVRVEGYETLLTAPVRSLAFADYTGQGLPFYGGNLTYEMELNLEKEQDVRIQISKFRCPLLLVELDGNEKVIYKSPYTADFAAVKAGTHNLRVKVFGNRINTFGCFHCSDDTLEWIGPDAWRTTGDKWSYEYNLKPSGVLTSPQISISD